MFGFRRRGLGGWSRRFCSTGLPEIAIHTTFRVAPADVLAPIHAASLAQHGTAPTTKVDGILPGSSAPRHAGDDAAKAVFGEGPLSITPSVGELARLLQQDDAALEAERMPPSAPSVRDVAMPPPSAGKEAKQPQPQAGAAPTSIYSCSMCDRKFRLQQSAEMHNTTRHGGQATITAVIDGVPSKGGQAPAGGASAAAGGVADPKARRAPAVPPPEYTPLTPKDLQPLDALPKRIRVVGEALPSLMSRETTNASAKSESTTEDRRSTSGGRSREQVALDIQATTPSEVSVPVSWRQAATATIVGRVVGVRKGSAVLRVGADPATDVTELRVWVPEAKTEHHDTTATDDTTRSAALGDVGDGDAPEDEVLTVVVPATATSSKATHDPCTVLGSSGARGVGVGLSGKKSRATAQKSHTAPYVKDFPVGATVMVSGRPRVQQVYVDVAARAIPRLTVVASFVQIIARDATSPRSA